MSTPTEPVVSEMESERIPIYGRVAVVVLTALLLLPTLRAAFVYDDTTVIRDNELLRGWGSLVRVWSSPYWPADGPQSLGLYRPVQLALLAFVWNLGKGAALSFHIYGLTIAVAASLTLWWLLRRSTGGWAALTAAMWFGTHPLHVETVASVANSSELVVFMATVGMVRVLWKSGETSDWRRSALLALLAAIALAAKESGLLSLPLALIVAWGWRNTESEQSLVRYLRVRSRHWLAACIGIAVVLAARLVVLGAPVSAGSIAAPGLDRLSAGERIVAMMSMWPSIASMVVWPSKLAPYYGPTTFPALRLAYAMFGLGIVAACARLAWFAYARGDRRPIAALSWMVLSYLPASNLLTPTGQILSDRTLFGVTAGSAMLAAWALDVVSPTAKRMARVIFIVLLAHNLLVGSRYAMVWTSHRALWSELAAVEPNEHMSYKLLGMDARARGDNERAIAYLSRALTMIPTDRQIRFELGQAQYTAKEYQDAVRTLSPLMRNADVRAEPQFVALYLDAVGRAGGSTAVADAARRLLHTEADSVARVFLEAATRK